MKKTLQTRINELESRLAEAEGTLEAIRKGQIDAIVVQGQKGSQIYTLKGANFTYRILIERMNEGVSILSKDGLILYTNQKFADIFGVDRSRIIGTSIENLLLSSQIEKVRKLIRIGVKKSAQDKILFSKDNGLLHSLLFSVNPMPKDTGGDLGLIVTDLSDIEEKEKLKKLQLKLEELVIDRTKKLQKTQKELEEINKQLRLEVEKHKRTAEALAKSQSRLQLAQKISHLNIIEVDLRTHKIFCSDEIFEKLGIKDKKNLDTRELKKYVFEEDRKLIEKMINDLIIKKKRLRDNIDFRVYCKDQLCWFNAQIEVLLDNEKEPYLFIAALIDISDRKRVEHELIEKEQEVALLLDSAAEGIFGMDKNGNCTFVNRRCLDLLGFEKESELLGKNIHDLIDHHREDQESLDKEHCRLLRSIRTGEKIHINDEVFKRKDGTYFPVEYWSYPITKNNQVVGAVVSFFNATKKREVEKQVRQMVNVLEQSFESVLITDVDGNIIYVNPAFERITGYKKEEVIGQNPRFLKSGLHDRAFYEELWSKLVAGQSWKGVFINRRKNGELYKEETVLFPIKDENGKIINYAGVKRDITEEEFLREQIFQAQKMESLGKLTGGVAHDFNNLLTVINGYAQMGLQLIGTDHPLYQYLDQIARAGERAANLTSQLLTFSRRQVISPKRINLNELIKDTQKMLRRLIGEDIQFELELDENLLPIKADVTQIDQILMNMVVNARDAILAQKNPQEKRITIRTRQMTIDRKFANTHIDLHPGPYALIEISDTGIGIAPETLQHIFEPFFTTKQDRGTGLGLSTVYGIVKQNKAAIYVTSEINKGTTFSIYWPSDLEEDRIQEKKEEVVHVGQQQRILIVEDDESVRKFLSLSLKRLNFEVLEAENGQKALDVLLKQKKEVDLVLTDLIMPGMNGLELAEQLKKNNIKIPVIFGTGYADEHVEKLIDGNIQDFVVHKPYSVEEIVKKINHLIRKSDESSSEN